MALLVMGRCRRGEMRVPVMSSMKKRVVEVVVDADGGEDVEVVLGWVVGADELGVGLEDGVGGKDGGVGDGEVGDAVRVEM